LQWKKLKDLLVSALIPLLVSAAGFLFLNPCLETMQRNMLKSRPQTCCEMAASYNGRIDWQSNPPKPIEETNMITKRPSQNTGALVLFMAAILVIITAAIATRVIPANQPGSGFFQKKPELVRPLIQDQTVTNFDTFDYYMTHPKVQTASNFDAFDYYMTHPKVQIATNFDAFDYYMTHPKIQNDSNFDAFDYYMTHPKLNNH
jgi:hypothetical protein